jgi:hypothetical protein
MLLLRTSLWLAATGLHKSSCSDSCWSVALTTHSHLALRLKKEQSYTSTPLLGLCGLF